MWAFVVKYKWWILGAVILIILIIIARRQGWFRAKPPVQSTDWKPAVATSTGSIGSLTGSKCNQDANFPLKRGVKGKQVGALQRYINTLLEQKGMPTISVDCDFGPKTEEQVLAGIGQDYVSLGNYISYNITAFE